jgi:hypothetical protein
MFNQTRSNAPKYVIVHAGQAHRDEVIALGIAMSLHGPLTVYRRDPTEVELEDPSVLILDVGGRHEPEKSNFDHHQRARGEKPECAYSLYAQHVGLADTLALRKWYEVGILLDVTGPFATAKALGLEKFPFELTAGPIEGQFMCAFEAAEVISPSDLLGQFLLMMGTGMVQSAREYAQKIAELEEMCSTCQVKGQQVLVFPTADIEGSQDVRDRKYPEAAVSLSWDDRGQGWSLYRYNDHPAIDFSVLEGDPAVLFAHKGGFIAKTSARLPLDEVLRLVERAIK